MSQRLIESSLVELKARRDLRDAESSADEMLTHEADLITSESADVLKPFKRRPYLSSGERKISSQLPESVLSRYFKSGEFVHVPMTREEQIIVKNFTKFTLKSGEEFLEQDLKALVEMLPGRRIEDIQNYLEDYKTGSCIENSILVYSGSEECEADDFGGIDLKVNAKQTINKHLDWFQNLQKQFAIFESSGSITQIACRSGIRHRHGRVMIGACATLEERYNRVGELLMVYNGKYKNTTDSTKLTDPFDFNKSEDYKVLIMDGHKSNKSSPHGQVVMRQTVTSVAYDPVKDFFYSGGYDGNVMVWDGPSGVSLKAVGGHPRPINAIACHSRSSLVAYGSQTGGLYTFSPERFFLDNPGTMKPDTVFIKPRSKVSSVNTVDHVAIPAHGPKMDVCYTGIGHLQSCSAGIVEGWDLERGQLICASERLTDGLTCMNISPCGVMMAAGTGGISSDESKGDGIVRVLSLGQDLKPVLGIKTDKYDLDCVSFGPNSTLLFIGETSDCSLAVYDLRFPSRPVFSFSHGNENADAFVAHAWLAKGRVLATGGHDGHVKLWDCFRGFCLLNTFEFNSGISCISYSDSDHSIWIGTDNGGVYMLGSPGTVGDDHPSILSGKFGTID